MYDESAVFRKEQSFAPTKTFVSQHTLAKQDVPQDYPRDITSCFAGIPTLMNGSGEDPRIHTCPILSHSHGSMCSSGSVVLRKEHFGGILYDARRALFVYINHPGVSHVTGRHISSVPAHILDEFTKSTSLLYQEPAQINIIEYQEDLQTALNFPLSATLELTYSCHHACKHCMFGSSPAYDTSHERTPREWIQKLDEMRACGLGFVYFSGGEIIRYKGYKDIFRGCDDLGIGYLLVSDLAAHSEEDFSFLETCANLSIVMVSLDGHDRETHDFLRGQGAFEKTVSGIRRLQQKGIPVGIYHSVHRKNLNWFPAFVEFCNKIGIYEIVAGVACPMGRGERVLSSYVLDDNDCAVLSHVYAEYVLSGAIKPLSRAWHAIAQKVVNGSYGNVFALWRDVAHGGTHRVHISPSGTVHMSPKLAHTRYSEFGNVFRTPLSNIWCSPLAQELRTKVETWGVITGVYYKELL